MRGTTTRRGFTNTLWLRARYCCPCNGEDLIKLTEYERAHNITRAKSETLLKYKHLFCIYHKSCYWVCENPDDPPTEEMFLKRQRRVRKRNPNRGMFKSELEYFNKAHAIKHNLLPIAMNVEPEPKPIYSIHCPDCGLNNVLDEGIDISASFECEDCGYELDINTIQLKEEEE